MRILYGISGENLGHSSRAKVIIPFLLEQGHEILVLTYGDAYEDLTEFFKKKNKSLQIEQIDGFRLYYINEKLNLLKTVYDGTKIVLSTLKKRKKIFELLQEFRPQVCISDFEPLSAYYSNYKKIPSICLGNHHGMIFSKSKIPAQYQKDYLVTKAAIKLIIPSVDYYVVLSFKNFKTQKNVYVCSPFIRKSIIQSKKPQKEKEVLVYLNRQNKKLIEILKRINENFIVYGFEENKKEDNILFKKKGEHFVKDLVRCKAIISSAGFSLMSEAVYLKKPMFLIPQIGQFEQTYNALFAKEAGFGEYAERPTRDEIEFFLKNLNKYLKNLNKNNFSPNDYQKVLKKILKEIQLKS